MTSGFLYRSSLVVTTSLTPECPSVLSQFLFWLLTTSPTSKPHTTTAELLIWLLTSLLLSRHYIILNDHESTFAFDTNCYDVVTWWCIYKRHLSLIVEDLIILINTNWNKLCRNSMANRKAKLLTHDGVNDSHIVSLLISNQLSFTLSFISHSNLRSNWGSMLEEFMLLMNPSNIKLILCRVDIFCLNMFYSHKLLIRNKYLDGWPNINYIWQSKT